MCFLCGTGDEGRGTEKISIRIYENQNINFLWLIMISIFEFDL